MNDLVECLDCEELLAGSGVDYGQNFELIYSQLFADPIHETIRQQLEDRVFTYFAAIELPEEVTIYDRLLLSLREKDLILTFNWDPLLMRAMFRNRHLKKLPKIRFLHGNVLAAVCNECERIDLPGRSCGQCDKPLEPTSLLYPIADKDYASSPYIKATWDLAREYLEDAFMLTLFGYGAPASDAAAIDLLHKAWLENPQRSLAQVEIIDIRERAELEKSWEAFFVRDHFAIHRSIDYSWISQFPRRSCDALAGAILQNRPWHNRPHPDGLSLQELQHSTSALIEEEHRTFATDGSFDEGKPEA